jgi:uncharacterized protein YndB with AHSA1/START domain
MGRFTLSRDIEGPAARIFRSFTDPEVTKDWMAATGVRDVRGRLDQAGTTYTLVIRGPWRFRSTVVRSEPPSLHETFHKGPLGASARQVVTMTEHDGVTRLELDTEYTMPLGALGRWLDSRWFEATRGATRREFDRLIELVAHTARDREGGALSAPTST